MKNLIEFAEWHNCTWKIAEDGSFLALEHFSPSEGVWDNQWVKISSLTEFRAFMGY